MVPSTYEDGTLYNVLPSGNKAPDETGSHNGYDQTRADFTFSRGSNLAATRVNANGLIEKGRENLLLQSNQFDTTWLNDSSITHTSGQSGYDGSNDAWLITKGAFTYQKLYQDVTASGLWTFSIYAKEGTLGKLTLRVNDDGTRAIFNLDDGSVYGFLDPSSKLVDYGSSDDLGSGWRRYHLTYNGSLTRIQVYPDFGEADAGNIYIQNAQLEYGLVATDYIETGATTATAGVLENTPRIDYSSGAGALLLESQRTNLVPFGNYFDGTGWSKNGSITTTTNTSGTKSPEGVYNATLLTSANATSEQQMLVSSLSTTSGTSYAFSVFAKKKDYDFIHLRFQGSGSAFAAGSVYFNISSGSVGHEDSGKTGYIEDYGNGWYRCTAVATATATYSAAACRVQLASSDNEANVVGDGVKGTYVFGCQFEAGSHVSSYVPTYGSAATRGADSGVSDVDSLLTSNATYTWFVEFIVPEIGNGGGEITFKDAGGSSQLRIYCNQNNMVGMRVDDNSQNHYIPVSVGDTAKCLFQCSNGLVKGFYNGELVKTFTIDTGMDAQKIHLGPPVSSPDVKEVLLFNEALSDAECVTLTTL